MKKRDQTDVLHVRCICPLTRPGAAQRHFNAKTYIVLVYVMIGTPARLCVAKHVGSQDDESLRTGF